MSTTLVTKQAPDFTAAAVTGSGEIVDALQFSEARKGKYAVLVFYPLDFTFVCPSELIALNHRMEAFKKRNVEVFAVSVDSQFTHNAWRNTAEKDGGIGPLEYTLVADTSHAICQSYGVELEGAGIALRGTFLIDRDGLVRHQVVNDLPLGRDMDELLRMVDALQFFEEHGEVCPAGWSEGKAGMQADPNGVASYLADHAEEL